MRILVIDNYDSFVYNLAQYVGELGTEPMVYRNDAITLRLAMKLHPDGIIISPGPGTPEDIRYFGVCTEILRNMSIKIPTLGVSGNHIHFRREDHSCKQVDAWKNKPDKT